MKKVFIFFILIFSLFLSVPSQTFADEPLRFDFPRYAVPSLPEKQPDDGVQATTTIGAMRRALWYFDQYEVLVPYVAKIEDSYVNAVNGKRAAEKASLEWRSKAGELEKKLEVEKQATASAQTYGFVMTALFAGAVALVFIF